MDTKIYNEIASAGVITEREVLLMKRRANHGHASDVVSIFSNGNLLITPEQADKGLAWLKDLWKTPRGVVRKRNPFKQREQRLIDTFDHFELVSFFNYGNFLVDRYLPVYRLYNKFGHHFDYVVKSKDKYTPLTIL